MRNWSQFSGLVVLLWWLSMSGVGSCLAAEFEIPVGDVEAMAAAMAEANGNGEPDTIRLEAGDYIVSYDLWSATESNRVEGDLVIMGRGLTRTRLLRATDDFPFVFFAVGTDARLVLRELTLQGAGRERQGSRAVEVSPGGQLEVENSALLDHGTRFQGGAIVNLGGTVNLWHSVFAGNYASGGGGAVVNMSGVSGTDTRDGKLTVDQSLFVFNRAGSNGGAIHNDSGELRLATSWILANESEGSGGGVSVSHGGVPERTPVTIVDSTINGNRSEYDGGGLDLHSSDGSIESTTINDNQAGRDGGGVYQAFGSMVMINDTVSGNNAVGRGGGIFSAGLTRDGNLSLNNVTLASNQADSEGGGIWKSAGKSVRFSHTILADNRDATGPSDCVGDLISQGFNLVTATSAACEYFEMDNITDVSAGLDRLTDNGGPTLTHALLPDSPAIGAGVNCPELDQRGARGACDIGAFKFTAVAPERPLQLNAGINDAWFELETAGQGMTIVVFPTLRAVFLAWFTFDLEQTTQEQTTGIGSPDQRWLTAFGYFGGTRAVLDVTLTSGGRFDNPVPAVSWLSGMGRIILDWTDCKSATMSYELETPPLRGTIDLGRVANDNVELCQGLGTQGPAVVDSVEMATNGR